MVAEDSAANAHDHPAMTMQKHMECFIILSSDESLQKLPIRHCLAFIVHCRPAKLLDDHVHSAGCHHSLLGLDSMHNGPALSNGRGLL